MNANGLVQMKLPGWIAIVQVKKIVTNGKAKCNRKCKRTFTNATGASENAHFAQQQPLANKPLPWWNIKPIDIIRIDLRYFAINLDKIIVYDTIVCNNLTVNI